MHVKFVSDRMCGRTAPADLVPNSSPPKVFVVRVRVRSGFRLVWADVQS